MRVNFNFIPNPSRLTNLERIGKKTNKYMSIENNLLIFTRLSSPCVNGKHRCAICSKVCTSHLSPSCLATFQAACPKG